MITKENIVAFISTLYKKRYDAPAPPDLLNKWSNLEQGEIDKNLQALFAHWGFTPQQGQYEIDDFIKSRIQSGTAPVNPIKPIGAKSKRRFSLGYIIFLVAIAVSAYVVYQYVSYKNLEPVYCLTDNVSLRLENGKKVGRLDLYERSNINGVSYTKLLKANQEPILKKFPDLDHSIEVVELYLENNFWQYLLGSQGSKAYASSKFLTTSKQEHDLFQKVFVNVAQNAKENASLQFVYRKTIIGCLRISDQNNRVISLSCNGKYSSNLSSIAKIDLGQGKYQVLAKLDDGKYYSFVGNVRDNEFAKIKEISTVLWDPVPTGNLEGNVLFKVIDNMATVFNCNGENQNYYSIPISESNKQIKHFEWFCPL